MDCHHPLQHPELSAATPLEAGLYYRPQGLHGIRPVQKVQEPRLCWVVFTDDSGEPSVAVQLAQRKSSDHSTPLTLTRCSLAC